MDDIKISGKNIVQQDELHKAPVSVIIGATSALGQAVARQLASEGHRLFLCARDEAKLDSVVNDITVRRENVEDASGGSANASSVQSHVIDFDRIADHEALVDIIGEADNFWFFYGTLPEQTMCEASWEATAAALHTNFMSAASLLTRLANRLEKRGHGCLVVVTSVAGDRCRKSNYVYGTAKGALSLFCQGLRNRLASAGVQVLTVKPGFIDTPMTKEIEKKPRMLWATAGQVASDMIHAQKKGKDVVYSRWFWRYILLVIQHIPERIFKNTSL